MVNLWAIPMFLSLAGPAQSPTIDDAVPPATVHVAIGDWEHLPPLKLRNYAHLSSSVMSRLYQIRREHKCSLPGSRKRQVDLSISFAAQYSPDGRLRRLLLPQLNCPEAEGWLGGTLLKSLRGGDYVPTGENLNGWYRGELSFSYEG